MASDLDEKSQMLGQHEARLDNLEASVKEVRDDVKRVLTHLERAKGSWKTLVAIGGITTAVIEGIHQLVDFLHSISGGHH
jgi:hypothetical protein